MLTLNQAISDRFAEIKLPPAVQTMCAEDKDMAKAFNTFFHGRCILIYDAKAGLISFIAKPKPPKTETTNETKSQSR